MVSFPRGDRLRNMCETVLQTYICTTGSFFYDQPDQPGWGLPADDQRGRSDFTVAGKRDQRFKDCT